MTNQNKVHYILILQYLATAKTIKLTGTGPQKSENGDPCSQNSRGNDAVLSHFLLPYSFFLLLHTLQLIVLCPSVDTSARMTPYTLKLLWSQKTWERGAVIEPLDKFKKCSGVNRVEVARTEVYRKWLESVDKSLCSPVRTIVTMEVPMNMRTVPAASSANETNSLPRGYPFPLQ